MRVFLARGRREEIEQRLANQKLCGDSEQMTGSGVRLVDHASGVSDEIRIRRELEQVVVFLSLELD